MTIPAGLRRTVLRARRDTGFLAAGVPPHLALVPVWAWAATTTARTGNWLLTVPTSAALVLLGTPVLTAVQRARYRVLIGVDVPRLTPTAPEKRTWASTARWLAATRPWRKIGYHLVLGPLLAMLELLVLVLTAAGLAGATVYAWAWALPTGIRQDWFGNLTQRPVYTAAGLLLLCALPWTARAVVRAEAWLALGLLGPSRAQRLQERVDQLAVSRTDLIEAVDAERRRIERDLHDGTQQRLVSLAVNLGLAIATRPDLPDAREVIARAHLEAKEAIAELNDLVRGLHPAVLEDRGLDAALSGLAARTPLPVRLRVDLEERVAPSVESVAYFVISEALTNATKHASAMRAEVIVRRVGGVLRVRVTDDGLGGADAAGGTGLSWLAKRVGSLDGAFHVSSPVGGPTTITAELPCAR
ncbi:histidine kinase [Kitasatospora aureofaciens]|uniref:histidine kinase n=1 Tax=Kitasatospora aureofaciens TaxID=1894 RepID=A0A1E7N2B7_KITAU|nr:histidine kinase [Kitasatospora aureofaciens]ARF81814.1 sensor histidine kinase [Kitasatospora aureofaciens]OEV34826.1 histidine kinase [Kitasatospora aureofaciens]UKZ03515.1 histidine kinase [Streptomyces viridifaciens]